MYPYAEDVAPSPKRIKPDQKGRQAAAQETGKAAAWARSKANELVAEDQDDFVARRGVSRLSTSRRVDAVGYRFSGASLVEDKMEMRPEKGNEYSDCPYMHKDKAWTANNTFLPPFETEGNRYVPSFLRQTFVDETEAKLSSPHSASLDGPIKSQNNESTNLLITNLSSEVDENFLLRSFGQFGPIASLKIHRPKTAIQKSRKVNKAHVAYMNREDARVAMFSFQGAVMYDKILNIEWAAARANLPQYAIHVPPPGLMAVRNVEKKTSCRFKSCQSACGFKSIVH